ncbi:MAG: molybdate ABC transporter substrate-binding protein [Pseudomonadota bacterium]
MRRFIQRVDRAVIVAGVRLFRASVVVRIGAFGLSWLLVLGALTGRAAHAEDLRAAISSNFQIAARALIPAFQEQTGVRVVASYGATGQLFAQISQGAPFDVYLAADQERPERAIAERLADGATRMTYAVGQLVLVSSGRQVADLALAFSQSDIRRIAIANPKTAPYGRAAMSVITKLGLADRLSGRIVRGANVVQAYQFIATGNVELALVSASLVANGLRGAARHVYPVPTRLHAPIAQDAVILKRSRNRAAAERFFAYLRSPEAHQIIVRHGYARP